MNAGRLVLVLIVAALAACERPRELATTLQLSTSPVRVAITPPLATPGPKHELCVTLAEPRRYGVQVAATFVGAAGDSVGPIAASGSRESSESYQLCITPPRLPATVVRTDLQAGDSLAIRRVTWFSGTHRWP